MRKMILFLFFALAGHSAIAAENNSREPRAEEAKKAYETYLQQLKDLNGQYKQITADVKKVLKDEDIPVWDEEKGELGFTRFKENAPPTGARVKESEKEMVVSLELPGLKRDSIKVNLVGERKLKVSALKKNDAEAKSVEREVELPASADPKGVHARYEDGVLTVWLSKVHPVEKEMPIPVN
ncbi:MAG: Hsp20/alpha crystallin family protein [Candidatus Omnitrophica bacterium]|nr:Hsp20/alpha crystallin family protein [Candidatus Omnitrophota bacterium]